VIITARTCRQNGRRGRAVGAGHRHIQETEEGTDRVHGATAGRIGTVVSGLPVSGHRGPGESGRQVRAARAQGPSKPARAYLTT